MLFCSKFKELMLPCEANIFKYTNISIPETTILYFKKGYPFDQHSEAIFYLSISALPFSFFVDQHYEVIFYHSITALPLSILPDHIRWKSNRQVGSKMSLYHSEDVLCTTYSGRRVQVLTLGQLLRSKHEHYSRVQILY